MLNCQKEKFNIPEGVSYVNVAYMSPNLKSVEAAGIKSILNKSQPWKVTRDDFFTPVENLKKSFAQLINCKEPQRIALIPAVSYGVANVVKNLSATAKDNIVLADEGFPSNFYSWQRLSNETGAKIKVISPPANTPNKGLLWNHNIIDAIDENTIAVSVGNVHWADGTLFNLKQIRTKATECEAALIIDGTQSVGALPFDVQDIQPDALICGGYKWLLGPYTCSVAYYGEMFDEGVPIEENWINRLDSHQFENLVNYQPEYKPQANRYGYGEQSNFIGVPMLITSINQLLDWGVENIYNYCEQLTYEPIQELLDIGCELEEESFRAAHLFGIRLSPRMEMDKLKEQFKANNVIVSQRGNAIRIATHVYNEPKDFQKIVSCFKKSFTHRTFI